MNDPKTTDNLCEVFRVNAKNWVELDSAARMLEESKSAFLSMRMVEQGDVPVSKAELTAKAGELWQGYIESMVKARKEANLAKVKLEYIRMLFQQRMSDEANARAERKM